MKTKNKKNPKVKMEISDPSQPNDPQMQWQFNNPKINGLITFTEKHMTLSSRKHPIKFNTHFNDF